MLSNNFLETKKNQPRYLHRDNDLMTSKTAPATASEYPSPLNFDAHPFIGDELTASKVDFNYLEICCEPQFTPFFIELLSARTTLKCG